MSGIPERGYGSWAQWKRRPAGDEFYNVDGIDDRETERLQTTWEKLHGFDSTSEDETTIREATEAQV